MTTVLLVEDNEMNRDMLARRLERRGYTVLVAVDGEAGVEAARSSLPDLILMDVSLPKLDGLDATRALKGEEATREIPILVLTAHAMSGDEEKCRRAGADDYDTKPVELQRLLGKMEMILGQVPGV